MSQYCKKLDHIPDIPSALKSELILDFQEAKKNASAHQIRYHGFETNDKNNLGFIDNEKEYIDKYGVTGGVSILSVSDQLIKKIHEFLKKQDIIINSCGYVSVDGGDHVGPHLDDRNRRTESLVYLVNAGSNKNTKTIWYEPKEEFKHLIQTDGVAIMYDRLIPVEEHILTTGCWYLFRGDKIHSVENLGKNRFWLSI